jgi:hypothetical protein
LQVAVVVSVAEVILQHVVVYKAEAQLGFDPGTHMASNSK